MSFWGWLIVGLIVGVGPARVARGPSRGHWARLWWKLSAALVFTCLILPVGLVLIMFLSDGAYDAIRETWVFLGTDFASVTGISAGAVAGSALMAWWYRRVPCNVAEIVQQQRLDAMVAAEYGPSRPLDWMYGGFAAAWYAVFGTIYAVTFPSQSNHFLTALALFVFVPGLFGGLCGACAGVAAKAGFQKGFETGAVTRRYAFMAGVAAGLVSMAVMLAIFFAVYPLRHSESSVLILLFGAGAVLAGTPFLGMWLLKRSRVLGR